MEIFVRTPSRLHFTLFDLNGEIGRVNGGCGVALEFPRWKMTIKRNESSNEDHVDGKARQRVKLALQRVKEVFPRFTHQSFNITVNEIIREHAGLGSWTQLYLAIAKALFILDDKETVPATVHLARQLQRGGTSGIGIAAFDSGGFIVDGGHHISSQDPEGSIFFLPYSTMIRAPPPILMRRSVPRDWHFLVIDSSNATRLGNGFFDESQAFEMNCPIPADDVGKVVRLVMMQLIPGFVEGDLVSVRKAINSLQFIGFKKAELKLVDRRMIKIMRNLHEKNVACGLSALGPTLYCILEDKSRAIEIKEYLEGILDDFNLKADLHVGTASNEGAKITTC